MLVIVVAAWGLTWPVNKVLLESLSPLWMAALRAAIATAALFAISIAGRRLVVPRRADMPVVLSITLLHMVGFVVLANVGLELVSTGRAVVLGVALGHAASRSAGLRIEQPPDGVVGRAARRADALLGRGRGSARLLGHGRGEPRSPRHHHVARSAGDARAEHRDRDAVAGRGGDPLTGRRGAPRPRRHRARHHRRAWGATRGIAPATGPDLWP